MTSTIDCDLSKKLPSKISNQLLDVVNILATYHNSLILS